MGSFGAVGNVGWRGGILLGGAGCDLGGVGLGPFILELNDWFTTEAYT